MWFWQEQQFSVYGWNDQGYVQLSCSRCLPDLDLSLLASYVQPLNQPEAVKAFYDAIR